MINVFDWSYDIDRHIVRIVFNQQFVNKVLVVAKKYKYEELKNVKANENELYLAFKNAITASEFITALLEKYPNYFSLNNDWETSIISPTQLSFSYLQEKSKNLSDLSRTVNLLFADCTTISKLTKNRISNIQLNADSSGVFMSFEICFTTQNELQKFIEEFNKFRK